MMSVVCCTCSDIIMNLLLYLLLAVCFADILAYPTQFPNDDNADEQIEERRRKHRRKKRPCTRQDTNSGRWFWGHDLTLFLGDVTIVNGDDPCHGNDPDILPNKPVLSDHHHHHHHRPGIFGGQKPGLLNNHRPLFPLFGNRPNHHKPSKPSNENKPVFEVIDEDEEQEQYRPGTFVGAPSAQIDGHGQDLTNFSPSKIFSQISRHFNNIVDPFIDLFV